MEGVKKPLALVAIFAFAIGAAAGTIIVLKSCGPDTKYWMRAAVHDEQVRQMKAAHERTLERNAVLEADNRAKDEDIRGQAAELKRLKGTTVAADAEIGNLEAQNKRLRQDAQAAIDANPALQALIANFDLQIKAHVEKEDSLLVRLTIVGEPYDTGEKDADGRPVIGYPDGTVTANLHAQALSYKATADGWETDYNVLQSSFEDEHGLRLHLERKLYGGKFWKAVALIEPPLFGALKLFKVI